MAFHLYFETIFYIVPWKEEEKKAPAFKIWGLEQNFSSKNY